MNLIGWYDTNDATGGSTNTKSIGGRLSGVHELTFLGNGSDGKPKYRNDRPVHKYYRKHKGKYLNGFQPQYHPKY